ncbi:GNAT family N-acetyltransferase [Anaeromyxobacter paludicola]|uniref:Glycosyl transferase group 1 n=1 Tax=Anaeromyxobacter paludicola TaxID=2918171 RepID=A0ABM7XA65_9BACT|nr:GNAT family N-acetyltransferase [Anaeromyxobacter paludicola]BDG08718.1 hypothetical protein AMPC_18310 [Anaeromyxobacter paludicola]
MALTVLQVAWPLAPVGPGAAGGAEQVLWQLDRALAAAGHRSLVVAQEGSRIAGTLLAVPAARGPLDEGALARAEAAVRAVVARALREERVDVVHLHGLDFAACLPPPGPPALVTLHLPPALYPPGALAASRPRTALVCVSEAQRARLPAGVAAAACVPNGVPLDLLRPRRGGAAAPGFALCLGRICAEKGYHLALDAARAAGLPLLVAGEVFPYAAHQRHFDAELRPRLDAARRYVGPVGLRRKRRLLAAARCLVVPSLVEETSSLAAMEALACGTPVVAFRRGALPEVVEDGVTGLLVDGPEDLPRALREVAWLDRAACRRAAEARFDGREMAARYVALYRELGGGLASRSPPPSPSPLQGEGKRASAPGPARTPSPPGGEGRGGAARRSPAVLRPALLTSWSELEALRDAWADLFRRAPAATPFQSPGWLLAWGRQLAPPAPPLAAALFRGRELAALLPSFVYRRGGRRVLGLLGGGVSDYQDLLLDPSLAPEGAATLLARLAGTGAFDALDLEALPPGSPLLAPGALPPSLAGGAAPQAACPGLDLPGDPAAWRARLSAKARDNLRQGRRRLERLGPVEVRLAGAGIEVTAALAESFRLHRARWAGRGEAGVLGASLLWRFHAEAARAAAREGTLRLRLLLAGGRVVASLHGFLWRGRGYAYLSGLDPAAARASPGLLLHAEAIEGAIREGARGYDLLRGREPYKYGLGAEDRFTLRLQAEVRAGGAATGALERLPGAAPAL